MVDTALTNSQYFIKYRFSPIQPPSDELAACTGRLIESQRPPDQFYHGWYPIRGCSFPGHEPKPGAGLPSSKRLTYFRNYRVVCDICDQPSNTQQPTKKDETWCCNKNSVAPAAEVKVQERAKTTECVPDMYWRYHDKHLTKPGVVMPDDCRVHTKNWFKEEIDLINNMNRLQKNVSQRERLEALRKKREWCEMMKRRSRLGENEVIERNSSYPLIYSRHPSIVMANGTPPLAHETSVIADE
ncbi:hypothetical protein Btru_068883 [Bulinus truncatus]|nr:hypothetical protein Btru_068883 [Bulinus truncatus]